MESNRKKTNYWIIAVAILILIILGFYSYRRDQEARNNGVYTMAYISKVGVGRNGWKVNVALRFKDKTYRYGGLVDWEVFSLNGTSDKRFFVKILDHNPEDGYGLIPILQVPDSIQSAPPEGWSEKWMKEHFPQVVTYIHDTQ